MAVETSIRGPGLGGVPRQPAAKDLGSRDPQAQLSALLDAAVDAVIVIDAHGDIETFNQAAERAFGYAAEEVLGRNVKLLMPKPYRGEHDRYVHNYVKTGRAKIIGSGREVVARRKDGSTFPVDLSVGEARGSDSSRFVGILRDLSQRNATEEALEESQRFLHNLMNNLGGMVYRCRNDGHWRTEFVSKGAFALTGHTPSEFMEDNIAYGDLIHREDIERVWCEAQEAVDQNRHFEITYRIRTASGQEKWVWEQGSGVCSVDQQLVALEGIVIDISESKETERRLAQREEERRLIIEYAPTAIVTANATGQILSANRACTDMLGYTESELCALTFKDITHPEDIDRSVDFRERAMRGDLDVHTLEKRYVRKDGAIVYARLRLHTAVGEPVTLVAQIEDRTARLKAEREAQEHRERLAHVDRLSLMGEMAASIAHEINQPLTAIAARTHATRRRIAAGQIDPENLSEVLEKVNAQAHRAGDVIRKLQSLAKKHESHRTSLDLNDLIRDSVEFAQIDARLRDQSLRLDVAPSLKPVVVDAVQIQQVILNLLRNAIDATEAVGLRGGEIIIKTRDNAPDVVEVAVADRGTGIERQTAEHLFDPFFTTKADGMGMGLSISHSIVIAHGGRLWFEPNEGRGTVFRFTLPAMLGDDNG